MQTHTHIHTRTHTYTHTTHTHTHITYTYVSAILHHCADKLLYQPIEAIDASSAYNLFNFVSDPIRRVSIAAFVCIALSIGYTLN